MTDPGDWIPGAPVWIREEFSGGVRNDNWWDVPAVVVDESEVEAAQKDAVRLLGPYTWVRLLGGPRRQHEPGRIVGFHRENIQARGEAEAPVVVNGERRPAFERPPGRASFERPYGPGAILLVTQHGGTRVVVVTERRERVGATGGGGGRPGFSGRITEKVSGDHPPTDEIWGWDECIDEVRWPGRTEGPSR